MVCTRSGNRRVRPAPVTSELKEAAAYAAWQTTSQRLSGNVWIHVAPGIAMMSERTWIPTRAGVHVVGPKVVGARDVSSEDVRVCRVIPSP